MAANAGGVLFVGRDSGICSNLMAQNSGDTECDSL
jgi:hypothetical protein